MARIARENLGAWVVKANPVLSGIEVLRAPRIGNPSHLNREQLAALERLREAG